MLFDGSYSDLFLYFSYILRIMLIKLNYAINSLNLRTYE